MNPLIVHCVAGLLLLAGFVGVFFPALPGLWLAWGGLLLCRLLAPEGAIGTGPVIVFGVLCAAAQLFDFLAGVWGVKRFGGTWRGMLGASVGLLAGPALLIWLPGVGVVIGMILGAALGAVAGELAGGAELPAAVKSGAGTLVGWFLSLVVRVAVGSAMIAWFFLAVALKALP